MASEFWHEVYEGEYDGQAYIDGDAMAEYVDVFFNQMGVPETFASVGCGPAVTEFTLARWYPETSFVCFDMSEPLILDNRRHAAAEGIENLSFGVAILPDIDLGQAFEVVYCMATLAFVEEVESALISLYEPVAPGVSDRARLDGRKPGIPPEARGPASHRFLARAGQRQPPRRNRRRAPARRAGGGLLGRDWRERVRQRDFRRVDRPEVTDRVRGGRASAFARELPDVQSCVKSPTAAPRPGRGIHVR